MIAKLKLYAAAIGAALVAIAGAFLWGRSKGKTAAELQQRSDALDAEMAAAKEAQTAQKAAQAAQAHVDSLADTVTPEKIADAPDGTAQAELKKWTRD